MSTRVSRSFPPPSPPKVDDELPKVMEKQGIVSILRSDSEHTKTASLRRTLSADMSSRKWLAQNGFSPMKKIASSAQLPILTVDSSSSSEGEDEYEGKREKPPGQLDVWSSILSQKAKDEASNIPAPYIHPLVKRASSLSEKSLQVCTEALGSETGSDGFSSYPSSESGDGDEDKEVEIIPQQQQQTQVFEKINTKKVVSRSFPPPLPSLTRGDGPSLHMHSRRQNGRLVLEAVSMASTNFFHAQRQNGRLLLTLLKTPSEDLPIIDDQVEDKLQEYKDIFEIFEYEEENMGDKETYEDEDEEEDGEGEEDEEMSIVINKEPKMTSGVINLHRAALTMKKLMGIEYRNPVWPHKFNKEAKMVEMEMEMEMEVEVEMEMEKEKDKKLTTTIPQSLPPLQRVAGLIPTPPPAAVAANSFNAYEYFWRAKPAVASLTNPLNYQFPPLENKLSINNPKSYRQQDMVNKTLVPSWRGCKENRRTVLIWEPYCVATS